MTTPPTELSILRLLEKRNCFYFWSAIISTRSCFRTYFIVASKLVRPGQLYRVSVTILQEKQPLTVRASISRNGVEMTSDYKAVKEGITETLLMRVIYIIFVIFVTVILS